jgi:hypothetical protein
MFFVIPTLSEAKGRDPGSLGHFLDEPRSLACGSG